MSRRAICTLAFGAVLALLPSRPADACAMPLVKMKKKAPPPRVESGEMRVVVAAGEAGTAWTLVPSVKSEVRKFSLMIPIPTRVKKSQVSVVDGRVLDLLEAVTLPQTRRSVDPDPCPAQMKDTAAPAASVGLAAPADEAASGSGARAKKAADYGVKVETHLRVGAYEIAVLKAKDKKGLARWLRRFKYRVSPETEAMLEDYLREGWRLLVARVNLKARPDGGHAQLNPLQIRFGGSRMTLPVRLSRLASDAPLRLSLFVLTPEGHASVRSTLSARLSSEVRVPEYALNDLNALHRAAIAEQHREHPGSPLLEYAGNPRPSGIGRAGLDDAQLTSLGVSWLASDDEVFLTRYRLLVDEQPKKDLALVASSDDEPFVVVYEGARRWQPASGSDLEALCDDGKTYLRTLEDKVDEDVRTLAGLTGWKAEDIRQRMGNLIYMEEPPPPPPQPRARKKRPPPPPAAAASVSEASSFGKWLAFGCGLAILLLVVVGRLQRGR
jgi:hypothetical protein